MDARWWWLGLGAAGLGLLIGGAAVNVEQLVAKFEGLRDTVYKDVAGLWTIGFGHLIKPGEVWYPFGDRRTITLAEAQQLLSQDLEIARQCVADQVHVTLTANQRAALESFIFNIGCARFAASTLLQLLNQGDYTAAAGQFGRWVYAGGVKVAGLENRRAHEAAVFSAVA